MSEPSPFIVKSSSHKNGSFTLCALPGVIMVFPRGSWSMSCTRDYMHKIVALRQQAGVKKFICLVDCTKWQLGTPTVLAALSEFNEYAVSHGMVAQWLIDPTGSAVTTQILAKALTKNVSAVKIVENIDACIRDASASVSLHNQEAIIHLYKRCSA